MTEHPEHEEQGANENALAEYWQCPLCGTTVKHGYLVCTGCRAEIVYGLTRAEWKNIATVGVAVGGMTAALLLYFLPKWLAETFHLHTPVGWGLGFYSLLPAALLAAACGYTFARFGDTQRREQAPRFFAR